MQTMIVLIMRHRPHHDVPAPMTTMTTPATAPGSFQIKAFVCSAMERFGMTEQEVKERAIKAYGSVERATRLKENDDAENRAAIEGISKW